MLHTSVDLIKERKKTKIRNLNNHVPHLTKCTIWKKFEAHEKVEYIRKVQRRWQISEIDTNKHHTQPRISNWKVIKSQESTPYRRAQGSAPSQQVTTRRHDTDKAKQYNVNKTQQVTTYKRARRSPQVTIRQQCTDMTVCTRNTNN